MNFVNQSLENFKKEEFIHLLETIFGVLIQLIRNHSVNMTKESSLICAIDLCSKCAWIVPIKVKKGTSIVNAFKKIISKGRKSNKIWVGQGSEF